MQTGMMAREKYGVEKDKHINCNILLTAIYFSNWYCYYGTGCR